MVLLSLLRLSLRTWRLQWHCIRFYSCALLGEYSLAMQFYSAAISAMRLSSSINWDDTRPVKRYIPLVDLCAVDIWHAESQIQLLMQHPRFNNSEPSRKRRSLWHDLERFTLRLANLLKEIQRHFVSLQGRTPTAGASAMRQQADRASTQLESTWPACESRRCLRVLANVGTNHFIDWFSAFGFAVYASGKYAKRTMGG